MSFILLYFVCQPRVSPELGAWSKERALNFEYQAEDKTSDGQTSEIRLYRCRFATIFVYAFGALPSDASHDFTKNITERRYRLNLTPDRLRSPSHLIKKPSNQPVYCVLCTFPLCATSSFRPSSYRPLPKLSNKKCPRLGASLVSYFLSLILAALPDNPRR